MIASVPSAEFQIQFLTYLQRLLDEGEFVASYKYALLISLADISVEIGTDSDDSLRVDVNLIAEKFVGYYWRQARPFIGSDRTEELRQNTGRQARIVTMVREEAARYVYPVRRNGPNNIEYQHLIRETAKTVKAMPLWRLQTIGGCETDLLYPNRLDGNAIILNAGIPYCFRRFHGFVRRMAQDGWINFVRNCGNNRELIGRSADLGAFLFGEDRESLIAYRDILRGIQSNRCFYCERTLGIVEVDHFVPWSRYASNLGHNFVLACKSCNSAKRDLLPAHHFLERWVNRNRDRRLGLEAQFDSKRLPHHLQGTETIALWAYGQAHAVGGVGWAGGTQLAPIEYDCLLR